MSLSILDPTPEVVGNPQGALDAIRDSATADASSTSTTSSTLPAKFQGKTAEEIAAAYINLEREHGRLANDLGQTRRMADQLMLVKRENDLLANGASTVRRQETPKLDAGELLTNPTETLEKYLEQRESRTTADLKQRLAAQEAALTQQNFVNRHPDWQQHTNDPEFINWARQTPLRTELAGRAAQNDLQSADSLLTEWKAAKPNMTRASASASGTAAAQRVSLERSATSGDDTRPAGKILRRADMMALRISDPDRYESDEVQKALMLAIKENRYR